MALIVTLDASLFVAACRSREPGFAASRALLAALRDGDTPLVEPAILPVETAAALRRAGHGAAVAMEYATAILSLPRLTLVSVDERLAERAAQMAARCSLRGADALYVTVTALYGATLVSLDQEQLLRAPHEVHACTPEAALRLFLK
jgi:predicted nucleic acid-binding protein